MRKKREPQLCRCGDHYWVPLTRGYITMVSPEDADLLSASNWWAEKSSTNFYARASIKSKQYRLHRLITGNPNSEIDHISGNSLDNRRTNLRVATRQQNRANSRCRNKNGYKGITRQRGKWRAQIVVNRKHISLGTYKTPQEAHAAYIEAAKKYFGEFARAA